MNKKVLHFLPVLLALAITQQRLARAGLSAFGSRPSSHIVSSAQYRSFIMPKVFEGNGGDDCVCPTIIDTSSSSSAAGGGSPSSTSNGGSVNVAPSSNMVYAAATGGQQTIPNVVYATSYYYPLTSQSSQSQPTLSYYPQQSMPSSMPLFPSDNGQQQSFMFYLPMTEHLENRRELIGRRGKRGAKLPLVFDGIVEKEKHLPSRVKPVPNPPKKMMLKSVKKDLLVKNITSNKIHETIAEKMPRKRTAITMNLNMR